MISPSGDTCPSCAASVRLDSAQGVPMRHWLLLASGPILASLPLLGLSGCGRSVNSGSSGYETTAPTAAVATSIPAQSGLPSDIVGDRMAAAVSAESVMTRQN